MRITGSCISRGGLTTAKFCSKRQQKIFFQISGAGHEALLVAAGMALKPGYDWFFPYYRDRALCLALGSTVEELLLQAVGAAADPSSGGRQMPSHWGNTELNIVSQSSATSTQVLHAVGCAEAGRYFSRHPEAAEKHDGDYRAFKDVTFHGDEVVYTSLGEGSTSQGEFWEALNTASNQKLPVLFVVEDNEYAISTPVEVNTPGGNISKLVANFPNFYFARWMALIRSRVTVLLKKQWPTAARAKGRRSCMGHVIRPYSHSLSDDDRSYPPGEASATPIRCATRCRRCRCSLLREGILDAEAINRLEKQVDEEVRQAAEHALRAPFPEPESIPLHVYSENYDPTRGELQTKPAQTSRLARADDGRSHQRLPEGRDAPRPAHHRLWRRRGRQQPRGISPRGAGEGQGRRLQAHCGLQTEFGSDRVFNSPAG